MRHDYGPMTVILFLDFVYENENENENENEKGNGLCKIDFPQGSLLARGYTCSRPSIARLGPRLRAADRLFVTLSLCLQSRACDLVIMRLFFLFVICYM